MNRKRHSPTEIMRKLHDAEADVAQGHSLAEVAVRHLVSEQTLRRWIREYRGKDRDVMIRLRDLEAENRMLRETVSILEWDKKALQEAARGNW